MSYGSALDFVTKAAQDESFFNQVAQATGPFDFNSVTEEQFGRAVEAGRARGFDFDAAELRAAYAEVDSAVRTSQRSETDATALEVTGYVFNSWLTDTSSKTVSSDTPPTVYEAPPVYGAP